MAETTYTYAISTDTANGKVDGGKLSSEIHTSSITIALERIDTQADVLEVVFKDELISDSVDNQVTTLTDIIHSHDGVPQLETLSVRIQETALSTRRLMLFGTRFVAELNQTTNNDVTFDTDRELQNVEVYVEGHTSGDYLELFVVHPQVGVIGQFGESVFIPPHGEITPDDGFDTSTIPAGLIVRFAYTSVAKTGEQPIVICHLRTHK